jgi:hypothetical protein
MGLRNGDGELIVDATFVPLSTDDRAPARSQKELSLWLDYSSLLLLRAFYSQIPDNGGLTDLSRLRQLQAPFIGNWLYGAPNTGTNTRMSPLEFQNAFRLRYGAAVFDEAGHPCPVCEPRVAHYAAIDAAAPASSPAKRRLKQGCIDAAGYHALAGCGFGGDKLVRHHSLGDVVENFIKYTGVSTDREMNVTGIGKERSADIVAYCGDPQAGKDLIIDIAITHGGQPTQINCRANDIATICDPDATATTYASSTKDRKYKAAVEASGTHRFLPIVTTHFGAFDRQSMTYLCTLAKVVGLKSGYRNGAGRALMSMFTELSCNLQRSNFRMVHRRRSHKDIASGGELVHSSLAQGAYPRAG